MRRFEAWPGARLAVLLGLLSSTGPSAVATGARPTPESRSAPCLEQRVPHAVWSEALAGLRLEFVDPDSSRTYSARGPYELLSQTERRVEVRAVGREGERPPTVTLVLTLDACHVGVDLGRDVSDPEFIRHAHELAEGFALIAASTAQQKAQEWQEKKHGVFTYYLLEGLTGQAARKENEFVTVDDLKTCDKQDEQ